MFSSGVFIVLFCIVLLVAHLRKKKNAERQRLPPGPPPTPVLGNIRGIDTRHPWKTYTRWGEEYGNIIYTRLLTQDIVVINSEKIAQDLLDRRSQNYSSRPASLIPMNELFGTEFSSIFLPYGDRWRLHRRFFHQAFHLNAAPSFRPVQLRKAHDLIMRLASKPQDFPAHLQVLSTTTIMSLVYDYDASGMDDPIVAQVELAMSIAIKEMRPEVTAIVAAFPLLKYLPQWFPGASFKRSALISRKSIGEWVEAPFEYVKKSMAAGTAAPSMVSDALLRIQNRADTEAEAAYLEKTVKEACASAYAAASETTFSTLMIFILAMVLYPDVQAQAQAEIDSVIGEGLQRLPHWEDRASLPYVEAVLKETLRWHPTAPLGIPHATVDDDIYEGYYIPKGATVLVNAWAISQNPIKFPEPEKFKPERFLQEKGATADDVSFAFGFGRRVCAGKHIADASLWITIVSALAVFRFEALPSWNPGPDGANVKWTEGVTTRPEDVPCVIKPRHENLNSEKLAHLIGLAEL
ncbi:cytochrome P450 [Boletus coccyginus]|nr:cytochrome P450 [Boletus coccyginus]